MNEIKMRTMKRTASMEATFEKFLEMLMSRNMDARIGDMLTATLNDGRKVDLVVTDVDDETIRLETRDCLGEYVPMTNMEDWLKEVWGMLPDALRAVIVPTKRRHKSWDGKEYETEDMLFLPSASEVFPPEECYGDVGVYEQMEYYKDFRNRIRAKNKGDMFSDWYWTSSACAGYSSYFASVVNNGNCADNAASNAHIAAPVCFRIKRI